MRFAEFRYGRKDSDGFDLISVHLKMTGRNNQLQCQEAKLTRGFILNLQELVCIGALPVVHDCEGGKCQIESDMVTKIVEGIEVWKTHRTQDVMEQIFRNFILAPSRSVINGRSPSVCIQSITAHMLLFLNEIPPLKIKHLPQMSRFKVTLTSWSKFSICAFFLHKNYFHALRLYKTPTREKNFVIQTPWNLSGIYKKVRCILWI